MNDYVSFHKGADCAEVRFLFIREKPKQMAAKIKERIEELTGEEVTVDGNIWEKIFSMNYENTNILFDSTLLDNMITATTVIFYFDYQILPVEEVIEYAEEFQDMLITMIEDEEEMMYFIDMYAEDLV